MSLPLLTIPSGYSPAVSHVRSLRRRQVLSWRLRRHHLSTLDAGDAVQVSRRLCGIQAQVMSSAIAAVALRRGSPAPAAGTCVQEDLATGRLVRTWAMRGTLHLLPADEAWAYLSLLAAARTLTRPAWQKRFGTTEQLAALTDAALKPLAWQGFGVQGAPRGNRTTFRCPDATVPGWRRPPWDLAAAARHVIDAYLGAHGPATIEAFDAWLLRGVTPKRQLRSWFADPGPALVRLLPGFDQFVLGPGTGDAHVVPAAHRAQVSRTSPSPLVLQ